MMETMQQIDLNKFELFQAQYLSHYMTHNVAKFHRTWNAVFVDRAEQYVALEAGRGSAKTTLGSVAFALFNICEGFDAEFQVVSRAAGTVGTSTKIMAKVKKELSENQLLIHDFGIQRGDSWGKEHVQVVRGDGHVIDFYSLGKHSSIRGSRGTVLIDDPQNAADCRSETVLEADEEWLLTDVLPVIIGEQRLIFIGTPISPLSLLSKVKEMPGFRVLSSPIEDPPHSGRSAWPELYPDAFLEKKKKMMGLELYASEYLCEPRVSGNPVFRSEWFENYDKESVKFEQTRLDGFYIVVGMDCAESKSNQADYTAIVTLGATAGDHPDIYVLDVRRERWSTKEGAEQLFLVFDEWKQHVSAVESRVKAPSKDAMIEEIEERQRIHRKYVNLMSIRPTKDKVTRAMGIQSICQEGRVYIDRSDPKQQKLLSELTMFTGTQAFHDDMVDAFVHALANIRTRQGRMHQTYKSAYADSW